MRDGFTHSLLTCVLLVFVWRKVFKSVIIFVKRIATNVFVSSWQAMFVKVNPLYFMIPATTGCSFAFMLPVSTPPNSIAFASGHLLVKDMVRSLRRCTVWPYARLFLNLKVLYSIIYICLVSLFTGENRLCDEHFGHFISFSGHEHVGPCHVQFGDLSRLGSSSQHVQYCHRYTVPLRLTFQPY